MSFFGFWGATKPRQDRAAVVRGTRNFIEVYQKSINHEAFNEKCQKKLLRNEKDEYHCKR